MRINDLVLNTIAFIGEVEHRSSSGEVCGPLHATGFFVSAPAPRGYCHFYFVTAKHVAEDLKDKSVYFRVNSYTIGTVNIGGVVEGWFGHPSDDTADLVVAAIMFQPSADIRAFALKDFVTGDNIRREVVGLGDEVYFPGLFTEIEHASKNWPIVRHGNIAMLPSEQLQTKYGYAEVYLVEARSIGGISGSPVLVRPTVRYWAKADHGSDVLIEGVEASKFKLLGLMHGHWDVRESEINSPQIEQDRKRGVNYGIAIVTPAEKILDTINQPGLVEMLKQRERELTAKSVPGTDSADEPKEKPFTKEKFEAALKKASRRSRQTK